MMTPTTTRDADYHDSDDYGNNNDDDGSSTNNSNNSFNPTSSAGSMGIFSLS